MKAMVLALGLVAVLAGVVGLSLALFSNGAQAQGQAGPAAPANVRATNGSAVGQAVVRWDAVADAAYYRIGWVNIETFRAVQAEGGREWLDVFAFHDVVNRGQTAQTLSDLEPGVQYAFIMASVGQRFGNAAGAWSEWTYLTTTAAATSCPTNTRAEPGVPGGATPSPTPTPRPTPTGTGDYDADKDGLIEVSNLAQLAAIRTDLDGDGESSVPAAYAIAFPNAMPRMGCPNAGCTGYELVADLDLTPTATARPTPAMPTGTTAPGGFRSGMMTIGSLPTLTATITPLPTCTSTGGAAPAPIMSVCSGMFRAAV